MTQDKLISVCILSKNVLKMQYPESFKRLVMDCIHYCSSSQIVGNRNYIKESPRKVLTVLCTPAGWVLTRYIKRKAGQ